MSLLDTEQRSQRSRPHRFTLEEYHRMSEMDFFGDRRVEFIDGEIIDVPPQFNEHAYVLSRLNAILHRHLDPDRNWIRPQMTLTTHGSAPEPDIAVLATPPRSGRSFADAGEAILVIEVSDTTLAYDATAKSSLYASGGVPEYWVVSIPDREIIVHRDPVEASTARFGWKYARVSTIRSGTPVFLPLMPEHAIDPNDILPPVS